MIDVRRCLGCITLASVVAGCGGGETTQANLPAEQKAPDYGAKSLDKMKGMYGTPTKTGELKK